MANRDVVTELIAKKMLVSTRNNRLTLFDSIDMSMYGGTSWPLTIQTIGDKKGKRYLFDLGFHMGKSVCDELTTVLKKKKVYLPKPVLLADNLIQATGFGAVSIQLSRSTRRVVVTVKDNAMMRLAHMMYGKESHASVFYGGIYSAFVSVLLNVPSCKLAPKTTDGNATKYVYTEKQ